MMEGKLNSRVIRGRVTSLPQIDPTLCKAGQAADAKATGDYLRLLSAGGGISKEIAAHIESRDNPHSVTAAQLGLGQVNNTADADKPVSLPQQGAIADACGKVKNAALLKSGGTMAGQLSMGGIKLTGLAAPEAAGDAVSKQNMEDYVASRHLSLTAVLTAAAGSGSEAPYTQTVSATGVLATDNPHVTPIYDSSSEKRSQQREGWCLVSDGSAEAGKIRFLCDEEKPDVDIPIWIEVNR